MHIKASLKRKFGEKLAAWWKINKRWYPWRETKDPFRLLIAELLLRKTSAAQVEKIYEPFLKKYPNAKNLSKASYEELATFLNPLGIEYKRADLLIRLSSEIVSKYNNIVPREREVLLTLPAVGPYAANAVLSLIHGEDVPMVDTNFIRIIERVFGYKSSKSRPRCDRSIWDFAQKLTPINNSAWFNLAVLDFGALVCRATNPRCSLCPLKDCCFYIEKII